MKNNLIILAEDQKDQSVLITELLNICGYKVLTAKNGLETLDLLRRGVTPIAVMTDLRMPGMSGLVLMSEMKRLGFNIPTIVVSGEFKNSDREQAYMLGARDYIKKPLVPGEFLKKVQRILG